MDETQIALRELVEQMLEASGLDLTNLARAAGLAPSTLTRFMNNPVKHALSARTLAKLSRASRVPLPAFTSGSEEMAQIGRRMKIARDVLAPAETDETISARMGWSIGDLHAAFSGKRDVSAVEIKAFALRMKLTSDFLLFGALDGLDRRIERRLVEAYPDLLTDPEDMQLRTGTVQA